MKEAGRKSHKKAQRSTKREVNNTRADLRFALSIFLILAALPLWAASPLAMRVDVRPTSIAAKGTVMTVEVQLAPPDRDRIGRQARMRVKLIQGTRTLVHILQDVDFDAQGATRVEYTWPPGRYELTLTVESLRGTAQGLWTGQVDIPEDLDQVPEPAAPAPKTERPATEPDIPTGPSPTETAAVAAPVVIPMEHRPESPAPATEKAATSASSDPSPAPEPETSPTAPVPRQGTDAPPPQPVATPQPSDPVFALVLDTDPSDPTIAARVADLRRGIENRAEGVTPVVIRSGDFDPTLAIGRALDALRPHSDARALVIVTDGRRKASRSDWKRAAASARDAGIPIFVVGLWNDDFDPGTRKQLGRLATKSGGRSYLLQPAESTVRVLEILASGF